MLRINTLVSRLVQILICLSENIFLLFLCIYVNVCVYISIYYIYIG